MYYHNNIDPDSLQVLSEFSENFVVELTNRKIILKHYNLKQFIHNDEFIIIYVIYIKTFRQIRCEINGEYGEYDEYDEYDEFGERDYEHWYGRETIQECLNRVVCKLLTYHSLSPQLYKKLYRKYGIEINNIPHNHISNELCLVAVQENGLAIEYIPYKHLSNEIRIAAVQQNGLAIEYIPYEYLTDDICIEAVKQNGHALEYIPEEFLTYNLCLIAVKQDYSIIEYVPDKLYYLIHKKVTHK